MIKNHFIISCTVTLTMLANTAFTQSQQSTRVSVTVEHLEIQSIPLSITTFGAIEPLADVKVSANVTERITKVFFDEGDTVEVGAPLVELDDKVPRLRIEQAEHKVLREQAALKEAENIYLRRKKLLEKGAVSQAALDKAETDLKTIRARLAESRASLGLAQRDLNERYIISPVTGKIVSKNVEVGEMTHPGNTVIRIQTIEKVRVKTYVSQSDISLIKVGAPARFALEALQGVEFEGRIESIGVQADARTGNFPVKLIVDNKTNLLRPGMYTYIQFLGITLPNQLLLPETALVPRSRHRVVYVVEKGKAVEREPVLRAGFSDKIIVVSGLKPGDQVITSGLDSIQNGTHVIIINQTAK